MGGGKGGGDTVDPNTAQFWYDAHYNQGYDKQEFSTSSPDEPTYGGYGRQGHAAGAAAKKQEDAMAQMMESMRAQQEAAAEAFASFGEPSSEGTSPTISAPIATGPSYEEQVAQQTADREAAKSAQLKYDSTLAVDATIERERSNARLLGIDFAVTPEDRTRRINELISAGGPGQEEETFTGDRQVDKAAGKSVATSQGLTPSLLLTEALDENLGAANVLG